MNVGGPVGAPLPVFLVLALGYRLSSAFRKVIEMGVVLILAGNEDMFVGKSEILRSEQSSMSVRRLDTSHVAHLHVIFVCLQVTLTTSYGAGFSEPYSKSEYETGVGCGFSRLARKSGRVAIFSGIGKTYVGSEFAADLVAQPHTGIQVRET
jgi:hypothetical protein